MPTTYTGHAVVSFITLRVRVWYVTPNALHTISKNIFVGNTWTFHRLCPKDHFCMLGRFFVCSSYMFCILANEVALVYCCNVPTCTGTPRTGHLEDVIVSLSAEVSMLIMYLSWNICYLLYGLYVTPLIYEDRLKFLLVGHFLVSWSSV